MNPWPERTHEERSLLNPAFCATILWHAGKGAAESTSSLRTSLFFNEAFLILPLVLHQTTRDTLPVRISSSLPVWISANPLIVASLPMRAKSLVPYTKEAIAFGSSGGIFKIQGQEIEIMPEHARRIRATLRRTSAEVQQCMKKAEFVGKWFAHTGSPETIFTLLGVRP